MGRTQGFETGGSDITREPRSKESGASGSAEWPSGAQRSGEEWRPPIDEAAGESRQAGSGETIKAAGEKAKEFVSSSLLDPLKDKARSAAEQQKAMGAEQVVGFARAIRTAAGEIEPQMPQAAGYIRNAADGVERFSAMLRERPVEELLQEFNRFAHRQPIALFGASVLAGFAIARFLKSSGSSQQNFGTASWSRQEQQGRAERWQSDSLDPDRQSRSFGTTGSGFGDKNYSSSAEIGGAGGSTSGSGSQMYHGEGP